VYFPTSGTDSDDRLQFVPLNGAVAFVGHNFKVDAFNAVDDAAESFDNGDKTCVSNCSSTDESGFTVGGEGTMGVSVDVAVWPVSSVTRYVTEVFVPGVTVETAVNVTTPVDVFNDHEPSPGMLSVVPQVLGVTNVFTKHVAEVVNAGPLVDAKPPTPVSVLNETDPLGITVLDSGVAVGASGDVTVGVIVERTFWLKLSATAYLIEVAGPVNEGNGSNVTTPVTLFNVYVPWFEIVSEVAVHEVATNTVLRQIPEGTATIDAPEPAESFDVGVNNWFVSHAPVCASAVAVGGGTTVGVIVLVADEPDESVIWYDTDVAVPVNAPGHDALAGVFVAEHGVNTTLPADKE
jgi:hypothetical protein